MGKCKTANRLLVPMESGYKLVLLGKYETYYCASKQGELTLLESIKASWRALSIFNKTWVMVLVSNDCSL